MSRAAVMRTARCTAVCIGLSYIRIGIIIRILFRVSAKFITDITYIAAARALRALHFPSAACARDGRGTCVISPVCVHKAYVSRIGKGIMPACARPVVLCALRSSDIIIAVLICAARMRCVPDAVCVRII